MSPSFLLCHLLLYESNTLSPQLFATKIKHVAKN